MAMNPMAIMKIIEMWNGFKGRHPKFPAFMKDAAANAAQENAIIEMKVTTPDGRVLETNLRVQAEDLEMLQALKSLSSEMR